MRKNSKKTQETFEKQSNHCLPQDKFCMAIIFIPKYICIRQVIQQFIIKIEVMKSSFSHLNEAQECADWKYDFEKLEQRVSSIERLLKKSPSQFSHLGQNTDKFTKEIGENFVSQVCQEPNKKLSLWNREELKKLREELEGSIQRNREQTMKEISLINDQLCRNKDPMGVLQLLEEEMGSEEQGSPEIKGMRKRMKEVEKILHHFGQELEKIKESAGESKSLQLEMNEKTVPKIQNHIKIVNKRAKQALQRIFSCNWTVIANPATLGTYEFSYPNRLSLQKERTDQYGDVRWNLCWFNAAIDTFCVCIHQLKNHSLTLGFVDKLALADQKGEKQALEAFSIKYIGNSGQIRYGVGDEQHERVETSDCLSEEMYVVAQMDQSSCTVTFTLSGNSINWNTKKAITGKREYQVTSPILKEAHRQFIPFMEMKHKRDTISWNII